MNLVIWKTTSKKLWFGALWCSVEQRRNIAENLRAIKQKHGFTADFEVKWTKVSQAKLAFLVVLNERKGYVLPWTAYLVEREHEKVRLNKRWEKYRER